jgi:hypothetical protein
MEAVKVLTRADWEKATADPESGSGDTKILERFLWK